MVINGELMKQGVATYDEEALLLADCYVVRTRVPYLLDLLVFARLLTLCFFCLILLTLTALIDYTGILSLEFLETALLLTFLAL